MQTTDNLEINRLWNESDHNVGFIGSIGEEHNGLYMWGRYIQFSDHGALTLKYTLASMPAAWEYESIPWRN